MKNSCVLLVAGGLALSACAPEADTPDAMSKGDAMEHDGHHMAVKVSEKEAIEKREAATMLVERFEVEACSGVDLIGTLRRTDPDGGELVLRSFQGSAACAQDLTRVVEGLGYSESEPDIFAGTAPSGAAERVLIDMDDDGANALIEWEVDAR